MHIRVLALLVSLALHGAVSAAEPTPEELEAAQKLLADGIKANEAGDVEKAYRLAAQAARLEQNGERAHRIGHGYEKQTGIAGHKALAVQMFQLAADYGQADSMAHIGEHHLVGSGGLKRDVDKGLRLLRAAEKAGYVEAARIRRDFHEAQEAKAQCLATELDRRGMRVAPFHPHQYFHIERGQARESSGTVFNVEGFVERGRGGLARLTVNGFEQPDMDEAQGVLIFSGTYMPRPPSDAGLRLARELRQRCDVEA